MFNRNGSYNLNDIDLNNLNSENSVPIIIKVKSNNDTEIIGEMMEFDEQFVYIMKERIKGLEKISEPYKRGNYEESLTEAGLSKDFGVVNDFFRYALVKKDLNKISLKTDMVLQIFPTIINMINCKYDVYFKTGINTAWTILNLFGDPIIATMKIPLSGGIDFNREEKIRKYKIIIDYFKRLRKSPVLEKNLKYNKIKNLNLRQFIGEVNFFINQCEKY